MTSSGSVTLQPYQTEAPRYADTPAMSATTTPTLMRIGVRERRGGTVGTMGKAWV
jgi:hypothetical protein